MEKEIFGASEKVWDRLVVSINGLPTRKDHIQQEAVIALSVAVCCMFFVNYETIKRCGSNDSIYASYRQLVDPNDSNSISDAWTIINSRLQKGGVQ
ncbi:MAG: hypothetical protein WC527_08310 [Candidatus Margulisiibacteriota bacterium]